MPDYKKIACEGKVKFESFKLADSSLGHNEKKRHAYHCRFCGKWHVGGKVTTDSNVKRYKQRKRELAINV